MIDKKVKYGYWLRSRLAFSAQRSKQSNLFPSIFHIDQKTSDIKIKQTFQKRLLFYITLYSILFMVFDAWRLNLLLHFKNCHSPCSLKGLPKWFTRYSTWKPLVFKIVTPKLPLRINFYALFSLTINFNKVAHIYTWSIC